MHGCLQTARLNGQGAVRNAGYLEWAATNDLIVVFPQNKYNYNTNMDCCWSTNQHQIGDDDYYNQNGIQNAAIRKLIARLTQKRDP